MLHLIYILVFTVIALLAVSNLIRSLITLSAETQKFYPPGYNGSAKRNSSSERKVVQLMMHAQDWMLFMMPPQARR